MSCSFYDRKGGTAGGADPPVVILIMCVVCWWCAWCEMTVAWDGVGGGGGGIRQDSLWESPA